MKIEYRSITSNIVAFLPKGGWPWQLQRSRFFCYKEGETSQWTSKGVWSTRRVNL